MVVNAGPEKSNNDASLEKKIKLFSDVISKDADGEHLVCAMSRLAWQWDGKKRSIWEMKGLGLLPLARISTAGMPCTMGLGFCLLEKQYFTDETSRDVFLRDEGMK